MTEDKVKVVAYIRISSLRQINNESPATQIETIQRYADQNGFEIVEWFQDIAKSGKNADRQGLEDMMNYCVKHKNEIRHWLVYNMKRASRDMDSYSQQVRAVLKVAGVSIRSATEPAVNESKEGRFMEGLLVMLGQLDNEGKAEVTVDNMRSLANQGYWQHPPLLGYQTTKIPNDLGKPRPSLAPDAVAAKVRQVLERYSEGDLNKAQLTDYAFSIGLRSKYGKRVNEDSINRMLKSPVYAGFVADKFTDYEPVPGRHKALISVETWQKNQVISNGIKRSGEIRLTQNEDYPLKGLLLCSNCKLPLRASAPRTGSGGKSPRYHCSRKTCKGVTRSVKTDVVHNEFVHTLKQFSPSETVLNLYKAILIREANKNLGSLNNTVSKIREEQNELEALRLKAVEKFMTDQITLQEKQSLTAKYNLQEDDLKLKLAQLNQEQAIRSSDIDLAIDLMADISSQWIESPFDAKVRFQSIMFPQGLLYDSINHRFGTNQISPLYRYRPTEKDSEESSKSDLVAGAGFEPATSWL